MSRLRSMPYAVKPRPAYSRRWWAGPHAMSAMRRGSRTPWCAARASSPVHSMAILRKPNARSYSRGFSYSACVERCGMRPVSGAAAALRLDEDMLFVFEPLAQLFGGIGDDLGERGVQVRHRHHIAHVCLEVEQRDRLVDEIRRLGSDDSHPEHGAVRRRQHLDESLGLADRDGLPKIEKRVFGLLVRYRALPAVALGETCDRHLRIGEDRARALQSVVDRQIGIRERVARGRLTFVHCDVHQLRTAVDNVARGEYVRIGCSQICVDHYPFSVERDARRRKRQVIHVGAPAKRYEYLVGFHIRLRARRLEMNALAA